MSLSVLVLTHNNEKSVLKTLQSVSFADEIIVVDDNSSDTTLSILNKTNHKNLQIFSRALGNDFSAQRNFGLEKATSDWILFVDADEEVPAELREEIEQAIQHSTISGYYLKRNDHFMGQELHHGETASVKLLRLATKGSGQWEGTVHEAWQIKGKKQELTQALVHHHQLTVSEFLNRINQYSGLRSRELYQQGITESPIRLVVNPVGKFLDNYLFKAGFLDGFAGLAMAWLMSWHSLLVRIKLRLLWKNNGKEYFQIPI